MTASPLAEFAFDIIVTVLRLPGIDGSAVIEAGRSHATRTSSRSSSPGFGR
jgi:hypothetical protein